jgi:hypothetical protein
VASPGQFAGVLTFYLLLLLLLLLLLAPWMLSVIEVATLLHLLLLLPAQPPGPYQFRYDSSLEDLVALGAARAAAVSGAYAYGSKCYER